MHCPKVFTPSRAMSYTTPLMSSTPPPGTCSPSFPTTRPSSTSFSLLPGEIEPCADPRPVSIGCLAEPTSFTEEGLVVRGGEVGLTSFARTCRRGCLNTMPSDGLSCRSEFLRGSIDRAGLSKRPRSQAKTRMCSVQWSRLSLTIWTRLLHKLWRKFQGRQNCPSGTNRICEQRRVLDAAETSSRDRNLQRTVEQDSVEVGKTAPQERISGRMGAQAELSKCPRSRARKVSG